MFGEDGRVNKYLSSAMRAFRLKAEPRDGKDSPGLLTRSSCCLEAMVVGVLLVEQLRKHCAHALLCGDTSASSALLPRMKDITKF